MNVAIHTVSLFSGVCGLDLGIDLAVGPVQPLCYVEREIAAAEIIAARMCDGSLAPAPIWSDITTFDGTRFRGMVDILSGGFPCTNLSVAGRQEGIHAEHSGLWFEYLRVITEMRPSVVFIENVPPRLGYGDDSDGSGMESRDASDGESTDGTFRNFDAVAGPLSEIGYDCEWLSLRASDVGAPHRRERVFVFAWRPER